MCVVTWWGGVYALYRILTRIPPYMDCMFTNDGNIFDLVYKFKIQEILLKTKQPLYKKLIRKKWRVQVWWGVTLKLYGDCALHTHRSSTLKSFPSSLCPTGFLYISGKCTFTGFTTMELKYMMFVNAAILIPYCYWRGFGIELLSADSGGALVLVLGE